MVQTRFRMKATLVAAMIAQRVEMTLVAAGPPAAESRLQITKWRWKLQALQRLLAQVLHRRTQRRKGQVCAWEPEIRFFQ
jgi:hypothetical protein